MGILCANFLSAFSVVNIFLFIACTLLPSRILAFEPCYEWHTLFQTWGLGYNDGAAVSSPNIEDREEAFGVLLRRAEIHMDSTCDSSFGWKLMIDPSKHLFEEDGIPGLDRKVLQDLYIFACICESLQVKVGQFRIPTSYQGLKGASKLWFPERSWVGWRFGNIRDTGITLSGDLYGADWIVGVFNGRGINKSLKGGMNEVTARLWIPVFACTYLGLA
jgi:hypothetical protein